MARGRPPKAVETAPSSTSFEAPLWAAADKLRGNMDAAEYKHVALGLIFLKIISDRFSERREEALADPENAILADERDWYAAESVFWVPEDARWDYLKANATSVDPTIGALIDKAMLLIETENPTLKGVLTKTYARPELDQTKLGEVVKLFSDLAFRDAHHVAGSLVALAEKQGCDLPELKLEDMQKIEQRITKDVYKVLTVEASVASRTSFGGTAPSNVAREAKRWLKLLK